ncbi:uncharacterized protein LOC134252230 [Saccostrea cucullata]|uniref:uncharacterized protein LOC134252230 n=1 Tax=Saccostrea cuccullata TaxID=36930 RepID=UPI002ED45FE1
MYMKFVIVLTFAIVIVGNVPWSFGVQKVSRSSEGWTSSEYVETGQGKSSVVNKSKVLTVVSPNLKLSNSVGSKIPSIVVTLVVLIHVVPQYIESRNQSTVESLVVHVEVQYISGHTKVLERSRCYVKKVMSVKMDSVQDLIAAGEKLGYEKEELRNYVTEQQKLQREERAAARQREKEEREYQLEMERMYHEMKMKQLQEEHELELANKSAQGKVSDVMVKPSVPKIPPFDENKDEIDSYLRRFERFATAMNWEKPLWSTHLSALLKGRALDVYALMSTSKVSDYDELKAALLRRYEMTEDGFKKKFRSCRPEVGETFSQFTVRLASYLTRWVEMSKITCSFEALFDLMLRDQMLHVCNFELAVFLKQNVPKTVDQMSMLADQFREARNTSAINLCSKAVNKPEVSKVPEKPKDARQHQQQKPRFVPNNERKCFVCNKYGHIATQCRFKSKNSSAAVCKDERGKGQTSDSNANPSNCAALIYSQNPSIYSQVSDHTTVLTSACHSTAKPMPLSAGYVEGHPVTLLRDSGCRNIVVRKSLVKEENFTGRQETCVLADNTRIVVPVAKVVIDSPYVSGEYECWCMENPVFDLIIGEVENARKPHDPDPEWKPNTITAVETRQQVKEKQKKYKPLKVPDIVKDEINTDDILREQQSDPSLETARRYAQEGRTSRDGKVKWFEKNGLLYREYVSAEKDGGKTYSQLIVPSKFRHIVMKLAHESIMSGHLAISRTISRILSEFFWPGMQSEIKRFCRSCDTCQRTVSKGTVTKVPLGRMPLIDVPFKRVAVDIVGPLHPPTEKGNRFILTLVDYATRFPQAKALPGINTERVAEALLEMFSYTGIPEEILTDMGSQFTSGLMKEVSRLISLKQLTTTPYHPMCNGLVERFNGTLKQMLKRMCIDRPRDWDKYLPTVLFAYREVPQESLGFAPFELLYGRTVRGPMTILKELWTKEIPDQQVKSTYLYILDLRERLESTWELAQENLKRASQRHKVYFDKKARVRNMKPGEKVLVLLPSDSNKLLMQWKGPFQIVKKIGKVDYQLDVKGKVKTYHANMLKRYVERCEPVVQCVMSVVDSEQIQFDESVGEYDEEAEFVHVQSRESYKDVDVNPDLNREERQTLMDLLYRYSDVLTDVPGHTHVLEHEIRTTTDKPVRVSPRQIPFAMMETVKDEVRKMLEIGVIEYSESPCSSPIVLVAKKDNTYRFCVDFRALNRITVFDAEPMPDVDAMFAKLSGHKYFSRLDLSKGYWQVPLSDSARPMTAFQTPQGLFQFTKMPFGLVTAPATFCRLMREVLNNVSNVDNFIDDILIFTHTFDQHISVLSQVLQRLRSANLTARPMKCSLTYRKLECLGHIIGDDKVHPHPDKVSAIQQANHPTRSFLGLCDCIAVHAFGYKMQVKQKTDASDRDIGAVLLQEEGEFKLPVAYASRKLKPSEEHYSTIEKECLGIIWSVQKFHRYLYGREFILETDHHPLVYLNKTKLVNSRLMRWALSLQPYRFRIRAIRGKDNVGADYLSRQ